jgi:putative SOS response-associated peptidase YedK
VILDEEELEEWLAPDADPVTLQLMLQPCRDDVLTAYAVSTAVNSPPNQGPELIAPV